MLCFCFRACRLEFATPASACDVRCLTQSLRLSSTSNPRGGGRRFGFGSHSLAADRELSSHSFQPTIHHRSPADPSRIEGTVQAKSTLHRFQVREEVFDRKFVREGDSPRGAQSQSAMWAAVLVCLLLPLRAAAGVITLGSAAEYQAQVQSTRAAVLVAYLAGPAPEELTRMLTEVDDRLSAYNIKVCTVDCASSSSKKVCAGKVPGSLMLYLEAPVRNPYTKALFRGNPVGFTGSGLDTKSIERWLARNFPSKVELLPSTLPVCDAASPSLVLISEKSAVTMLLKSIAFSFPKIKVFQSHGLSLSMVQEKGYPAVTALPVLGLCSGKLYAGDLKNRTEIVAWIESTTNLIENEAVAADSAEAASDNQPQKRQQENVKTILSAEFSAGSLDERAAWLVAVVPQGAESIAATSSVPGWEKLVGLCEGVIRPAVVVCSSSGGATEGWGQQLCARGEPFVMVFPHGASSRKKIYANPHTGSHIFSVADLEGARKSASDSLPEESVYVMPEEGIQEFIGASHQKSLMSVIVLSDKTSSSSTPPFLRNLALSLNEYAHVAFVSSPSKQFLSNIGNPTLPTAVAMFLLPEGEGGAAADKNGAANFQVVVFDSKLMGPLRFSSLQSFCLQAFSRSNLAAAKFASKDGAIDDGGGGVESRQAELLRVTTEAEWNEHCGATFRGICAIGLVGESSRAIAEASLNSVMRTMGRSGGAFKFLIVDAECQYGALATRFDATYESLPALVAYSPSKARYALFTASFKEDSIKEFLGNIVAGKASTKSIPQRPFFSAECDSPIKAALEEESSEAASEAEAFLEEIRQEELAKKAALKREMQEEEARAKAEAAEALKAAASPRKIVRKVKKKKGKKPKKEEL